MRTSSIKRAVLCGAAGAFALAIGPAAAAPVQSSSTGVKAAAPGEVTKVDGRGGRRASVGVGVGFAAAPAADAAFAAPYGYDYGYAYAPGYGYATH